MGVNSHKVSRSYSDQNQRRFLATISFFPPGYGHVTPKTQLGKIVTILYSLIGIPLTLIFLANIGDLMASGLRYSYSRLCCRWCRGARRRNEYDRTAGALRGGRLPPLTADDVGSENYMPTSKVSLNLTLSPFTNRPLDHPEYPSYSLFLLQPTCSSLLKYMPVRIFTFTIFFYLPWGNSHWFQMLFLSIPLFIPYSYYNLHTFFYKYIYFVIFNR